MGAIDDLGVEPFMERTEVVWGGCCRLRVAHLTSRHSISRILSLYLQLLLQRPWSQTRCVASAKASCGVRCSVFGIDPTSNGFDEVAMGAEALAVGALA